MLEADYHSPAERRLGAFHRDVAREGRPPRRGAGGMGVYRAQDRRLGRDVAVKILRESFARDTERMRRFKQEARAVSLSIHPGWPLPDTAFSFPFQV
jgi:hypothetical protein